MLDPLESYLRAELEPLTYLVFFGALALFGLAETKARRSFAAPDRGRRWPTNFGLTLLNVLVLGALPVSGIAAADWARERGIGLLNAVEADPVAAFAATLLLRSLVSWAVHVAMHKIPILWRVHRVHHADTALDVSTTVRFHPLEFAISTGPVAVAIAALGLSPVALMVYELFDAAMAIFTHADIRLPTGVDRVLRWVLTTPDMHRLHHSTRVEETDSNYGATLSVWDRLFGTYRTALPQELASMELGLAGLGDGAASLVRQLVLPFGSGDRA